MMTGQTTTRRGPTFLRVAPLRWLTAELIPFGCLVIGLGLAVAVRPVAWLFLAITLFAGCPLSLVYLLKMHGVNVGWVFLLLLEYLGCFVVGALITGLLTQDGTSRGVTVTSGLRDASVALAVLLAVSVAVAVASGERWARRNFTSIAPSDAASWRMRRGNRGIWAPRVWLSPQ